MNKEQESPSAKQITSAALKERGKRCAIYVRKSTFKGLEQKYNSLEAQEDIVKGFIRTNEVNGWVYQQTFSDAGLSGGTTKRPALQSLIKAAKNGEYDILLVFKLDRLARNQRDFLNLLNTLSEYGVEVASATEPFDSSSYLGRAMRNLLGVFAEMEREMVAERTREKFEAARRRGLYPTGPLPYGYVRKEGKLVIEEEQAKHVRWIFEQYHKGSSSLDISRDLNKKPTPPKNKTSTRPWNPKKVCVILQCPLYAGFIKSPDSGELFQAQHKAIVDRELWSKVQERYKKIGKGLSERLQGSGHSLPFPLLGILKCGGCGKLMVQKYGKSRNKIYRYYACPTRSQSTEATCDCPHLNADEVEQFVIEQLIYPQSNSSSILRDNPDFIAAVIKATSAAAAHPQQSAAQQGKIADCLFNLEQLFRYASPKELDTIFHKLFCAINYDWQGNKIDFRYKKL